MTFTTKKIYHVLNNYYTWLTVFLILNAGTAFAETDSVIPNLNLEKLPIKTLSKVEMHQLTANGVIMNSMDSYRKIHLLPESSETKAIIDRYKKLRPNFLAEAMFIMPVEAGEEQAVLTNVKSFLQSVEEFGSIPYYSKQNNVWNPMFENIIILELPVFSDGSEGIITEQMMRPFNPYTSVYRYYLSEGVFMYETYNRTPLYYKWMKGVDEEEMSTTLLVQAYPGYLFFYGLGGARAFTFFGLFGNRLDVAFIGRIEAFFEWFHQEFVLSRLME